MRHKCYVTYLIYFSNNSLDKRGCQEIRFAEVMVSLFGISVQMANDLSVTIGMPIKKTQLSKKNGNK